MRSFQPAATALLAAAAALPGCTAAPTSVEASQGPLYREIAALQEARDTGGGRLAVFMRHPDRDLRVQAATALGRMPYPEFGAEVTGALRNGLYDGDRRVRAAAAFALGLRGDPVAADDLVQLGVDPRRRDPSPIVRALAVEAASKLDRPDTRLELLAALNDEESSVRLEAVEGAHRWPREEPTADEVDRRLLDQLAAEDERDVLVMALFSLQRRRAPTALDAFLENAASRQAIERMWAVRGLLALEPNDRTLRTLAEATRDPDWRVAYEATAGLGSYDLGVESATLLGATRHRHAHVRRAAWEALARRLARVDDPNLVLHITAWKVDFDERRPRRDPSPEVRAAFGAALVYYERLTGISKLSLAVVQARLASESTTAEEWIAFATALGDRLQTESAEDPSAAAILMHLAEHEDVRIAGAAVMAQGNLSGPETRDFLRRTLAHEDNGLRLAAVLALRERPDPADIEALAAAYASSGGDIGPEVRFNVLRNLGALGGDPARDLLLEAMLDEDLFVRRVAREELEAGWPDMDAGEVAAAVPRSPDPAVPPPDNDQPLYRRNPRVRIETTKGDMVFDLFPREAPTHVHNFITLAERGHYDGTLFHRVVPNFVIQGGDYRGDGNGGTTFRGEDSLRHEIGPRKFVRGSLGMPRNENPDSGGSQIFVTHRPTPHLDGRYTIFGQLRGGLHVLDAIEVGDRIVQVRRIPAR